MRSTRDDELLTKRRQEDIANTQLRNERGSSDDGGRTTKGTDVRIASSPGWEEKGDFFGGSLMNWGQEVEFVPCWPAAAATALSIQWEALRGLCWLPPGKGPSGWPRVAPGKRGLCGTNLDWLSVLRGQVGCHLQAQRQLWWHLWVRDGLNLGQHLTPDAAPFPLQP